MASKKAPDAPEPPEQAPAAVPPASHDMTSDTARATLERLVNMSQLWTDGLHVLDYITDQAQQQAAAGEDLVRLKAEIAEHELTKGALVTQVNELRASLTAAREAREQASRVAREQIDKDTARIEANAKERQVEADRAYAESIRQQADRLEGITRQINEKSVELEKLTAAVADMREKIKGM